MMTESAERIIKRSSLYDVQQRMGARFGESYGWEMARSFTDTIVEHQHVRSSVGLIDLTYHGAVKVSGSESLQFLNGLVTNDVKTLAKGKGMRAAFLTGHGKVKALCRVLNLGDEFLIITDPQTHEKVYKYIFPFSYAGDFKVEDVSDQFRLLSVQGPNSALIMKDISFEPISRLEENDWSDTIIAGYHVTVVRASHTGETGFDIFTPVAGLKDIWEFILLKGGFHSIASFGIDALESLRVEAGIPVYGKDVDESNMMLELGLTDAVSFTKGCYTGQEAVAMATYRGHVSKKLSGLVIASDEIPSHSDKVFKEGKEIGYVTSALKSPSLGAIIAMGYLKYGFFDPGTSVEVQVDGKNAPAYVVELPFYRAVDGNDRK